MITESPGQPEPSPGQLNLYHCNWGADGALDGYFVAGAFENYYILETDQIYTIPFKGYNNALFSFTKIYPL